jgi:hypothetical protein
MLPITLVNAAKSRTLRAAGQVRAKVHQVMTISQQTQPWHKVRLRNRSEPDTIPALICLK